MTAERERAAIRHSVYADVLGRLPWASYEQAERMAANLRLDGDEWKGRFINLRLTPDVAVMVGPPGHSQKLIEAWCGEYYGDYLQHVSGFYRRDHESPWRLNLPAGCALYGYRSAGFLTGILCQPLDRLNTFFLLSSSKFGGAKAQPLTPRDRLYFTQFEEVA